MNKSKWAITAVIAVMVVAVVMSMLAMNVKNTPKLADGVVSTPKPSASASPTPTPSAATTCTSSVHAFTLDPGKEVPYAYGPAVTQTTQATILQNLHDRRCTDPYLTASHWAMWGKIQYSQIDATAAAFIQDPTSWMNAISQMEFLEAGSSYSTKTVPAGSPSLYMKVDAAGKITSHQGSTSHAGTAIVFTRNGVSVTFRLNCGFQPILPPGQQFPSGVPPICTAPEKLNASTGLCTKDPTKDPQNQGNNRLGGGGQAPGVTTPPSAPGGGTPPATYVAPVAPTPTATPVPVVTPTPVPSPSGSPSPTPTPVDPGTQPINNGSVPPTSSGPTCNPVFQTCT